MLAIAMQAETAKEKEAGGSERKRSVSCGGGAQRLSLFLAARSGRSESPGTCWALQFDTQARALSSTAWLRTYNSTIANKPQRDPAVYPWPLETLTRLPASGMSSGVTF